MSEGERTERILLGQMYRKDWDGGGLSFSGNFGMGRLVLKQARDGERYFLFVESKPRDEQRQAPAPYGQQRQPAPGYGQPRPAGPRQDYGGAPPPGPRSGPPDRGGPDDDFY